MNGKLVVFEGVCSSGKTTLCRMVVEELGKRSIIAIYNHGAFTKTERGQKLRSESARRPMELTTVSYFADLIADTKDFIIPELEAGNIVIQDRYADAITTYIAAYEKAEGRACGVYDAADVLTGCGALLIADMRIFCVPPLDIVIERIKTSKASEVHDLYHRRPELLEMVYAELCRLSETYPNARIINTVSLGVSTEAARTIADALTERAERNACE